VRGLGAHQEDRALPGWSPEGEQAAGGILGWGRSSEEIMDMWLNTRFHRDPVFNRTCGRIAFGGMPNNGYSCRNAGGLLGRSTTDLITWPGDGDTDIPTTFAGELPNPFPPGMTSSGTLVVVDFGGRLPKQPAWRLLDPEQNPVETLTLDQTPICFVAKQALKTKTTYTVEVTAAGGFKHTFSFTTR
jgi:hypothetical protein